MLYGSAEEASAGSSAVIVPRVSSADQAKDEKLSLDQQEALLRGVAKKRDWNVQSVIRIGASASKPDSHYFAEIDKLADRDDVQVVLFAAVDRYCRDFMEGITRLNLWPKCGLHIYFGDHRYDPSNPDDICMTLVQLAFSQLKKDKNQKAALQKEEYVRLRGRVYLHKLPPGYKRTDTKTLEKSSTANAVDSLWQAIESDGISGVSRLQWVLDLVAEYRQIQHRSKKDRRKDAALLPIDQVLRELLHHPLYSGEIPYSGNLYAWPDYAIGDQELLGKLRTKYPSNENKTKKQSKNEQRLSEAIEAIGLLAFLSKAFRERRVSCPGCNEHIRLNGYKVRGTRKVPVFQCGCTKGVPMYLSRDMDRYCPGLCCFECGAADPSQLRVERCEGAFLVRCLECDWVAKVNRSPWAPKKSPPPKPDVPANVSQKRLF